MTDACRIEDIPDEVFNREHRRRAAARDAAYQVELRERAREADRRQEIKDRAFADGLAITWEQFTAIENYVRIKMYAAQ
jgi:hypothetical protein